ncbi:MAG: toll/interleukin-1 receptor domain-containing protein, partial [Geminicoccaceae bacterium]
MQQIFISYARDDDESPPDEPGAKGFVTYLHDQLRYELTQLGQPRPELWRDRQRIGRSDQFEPHLSEALARSSLLLVILSRNWMDRGWCQRELEEFAKRFPNEGERKVRERIIVVGKNDVDITSRPKWIQGQESYNLFWTDPESRQEIDFFVRGKIVDPRYLDRLRELARDVWNKAQQEPHPDPNGRPGSVDPTGRSVFLAKPGPDMIQAYDTLVCELAGRGYHVVPDPATELARD